MSRARAAGRRGEPCTMEAAPPRPRTWIAPAAAATALPAAAWVAVATLYAQPRPNGRPATQPSPANSRTAQPPMAHDDTVTSEPVLRATAAWNGAAYTAYPAGVPELTVRKVTIPAHSTLSWHTHPMPSAAYLVSGALIVEEPGGATRHVVPGEAFAETVHTVHTVHRGVAGDQPAVLLVFYAGVRDMPLAAHRAP